MFNGDLKKHALEQLDKARNRYQLVAADVEKGLNGEPRARIKCR